MIKELLKQADEYLEANSVTMSVGNSKLTYGGYDLVKALADELRGKEWQPLIKMTEAVKANRVRIYSFKPSSNGGFDLCRAYKDEPYMGRRMFDYFIDLPQAPKEK